MNRQLLYILSFCALFGCGTNNSSKTIEHINTVVNHTKEDEKLSDVITKPCAIIISPTVIKMDSLKNVSGDDYSTIVDDNLFYIGTARLRLDSLKMVIIEKESIGTVAFRQKNGNITTIHLNEFYWGIILFNTLDAPVEADITTFETEVKQYMAK